MPHPVWCDDRNWIWVWLFWLKRAGVHPLQARRADIDRFRNVLARPGQPGERFVSDELSRGGGVGIDARGRRAA